MTDAKPARYVCKHCADIGWRQLTRYVARPLSTNVPARQLAVTWWRPCPKQCDASITQPIPSRIIANASAALMLPDNTGIVTLSPINGCHECQSTGARTVKVSIRDKEITVYEPCFKCESVLHRAPIIGPMPGPTFDFARDLELANIEIPKRPNPRIQRVRKCQLLATRQLTDDNITSFLGSPIREQLSSRPRPSTLQGSP